MLSITKTFEFCASHRLFNPDWTDEENQKHYGKCSNPAGHGHNYLLEVSVSGSISPDDGMILNADLIEKIVKKNAIAKLDHKNLNQEVDWLPGNVVSLENLTEGIWAVLEKAFQELSPPRSLAKLKIWETSRIYVERTAD